MRHDNLRVSGIAGGITFGVGLVVLILVPGLGGTSSTASFDDFYTSDQRRGLAVLLGLALTIGCWLLIWMFTELRARLAASARADLARLLGVVGLVAVMVGTAIDLGPAMAQTTDGNSDFVGIPIAHAMTQAGAGTAIIGLLTCAVAVVLNGLEIRSSGVLPRWTGTMSVIVGVLLVGSFMAAPGFLLPLWAIVLGITARRTPATS